MSATRAAMNRGSNVVPQEIQALLRACLDYDVEQVRRSSGRISHLFYDVQQRMNEYGPFPERKLYMLQKYYLRTEQDFKSGKLRPYPPEARELWGKPDDDDDGNDKAWKELVAEKVKRKRSANYMTKQEIAAVISECLKRNIEKLPADRLYDTFTLIVRKLQNKKLFLGRTVEDLQRAYARLKKRYLQKKNPEEYPDIAAKLWDQPATSSEYTEKIDFDTEESVIEKVESNDYTEAETRVICRVCQTEDLIETKHLFEDVFQNQTYAEIIHETINVKMMYVESDSSMLCQSCTRFVENLINFVRQCQEHCEGTKATDDYPMEQSSQLSPRCVFLKSEIAETNEIWLSIEKEDDKTDFCSNGDDCPEVDENSFDGDENVDADCPMESSSDERVVDEAEPDSTISTEERNLKKFRQSRGIKKRRQCEICGKTVLDLPSHIITHVTTKSVSCDFCPKVFKNRRQLLSHRNTHTKERTYPCSYCDKVFYVWKSRKDHETMHQSEVNNINFSCNQCDAVYKVEANLKIHIKHKHMGITHLLCKECDFSTFIKKRLLNHVRSIHTKERPYLCPYCGFTCNSCTGYFVHFKRHKKSGEATKYSIKCAYCNELYEKDAALEAHIITKHPDHAVLV